MRPFRVVSALRFVLFTDGEAAWNKSGWINLRSELEILVMRRGVDMQTRNCPADFYRYGKVFWSDLKRF